MCVGIRKNGERDTHTCSNLLYLSGLNSRRALHTLIYPECCLRTWLTKQPTTQQKPRWYWLNKPVNAAVPDKQASQNYLDRFYPLAKCKTETVDNLVTMTIVQYLSELGPSSVRQNTDFVCSKKTTIYFMLNHSAANNWHESACILTYRVVVNNFLPLVTRWWRLNFWAPKTYILRLNRTTGSQHTSVKSWLSYYNIIFALIHLSTKCRQDWSTLNQRFHQVDNES
jgi:hypothetical protein